MTQTPDTDTQTVTIHTDGSCLGNPGPGGWCAILSLGESENELSGGYALTTNNRMEILAVVEALSSLTRPCTVDVWTDSQYVRNAIEKKWLAGWQKKGWLNAEKKPVKNRDLWERLIPLIARHKVRFHWLRGHSGHAENERCDQLARAEASKRGLPRDPGYPEK